MDELCGYEAMGAFAFPRCTLMAGEKKTYILLLGMAQSEQALREEMREYCTLARVEEKLAATRRYWKEQNNVQYATGNRAFDQWMYWVDFQPMLRRIYGCSFLPHHDYRKRRQRMERPLAGLSGASCHESGRRAADAGG